MIQIDGSQGEGGGQILRSALTLSLLSGQPFHIRNIRAGRPKPGLRPQHLEAVRAAGTIGLARVEGAEPGSQSLRFFPGTVQSGTFDFEIKTAGAATLVLQTVLLPLSLAQGESHVAIRGGTHVPWSPSVEYLQWAWLPMLTKLGFEVKISCDRAGFYPRGGGEIKVVIQGNVVPASIELLDRGELQRVSIFSASANLPTHVIKRQADHAHQKMKQVDVPIEVRTHEYESIDKGSMLLILPHYKQGNACFFSLGERGKPAEKVADEAVNLFYRFQATHGAVDPYLADQILLPLALSILPSQFSTSSVTEHLRTNANVIQTFEMAQVNIDPENGHVDIRPKH